MALVDESDAKIGIARTADHYSRQWGRELNFQRFVAANPEVVGKVLMGRQLGWLDLFERIRCEAASKPVALYEAACGFADVARLLFADPPPPHLDYVGVDIHNSLDTIEPPPAAKIMQWDITDPLPDGRRFDYIVCRASIHHTPDPAKTYAVLASQLAAGGTLAISVYTKKAPMREAVDDALRSRIVPLTNEEGLAVARQFTQLGRDLQLASGRIVISEDLPFLGIKAGHYSIQSFIYDHLIKCWHNLNFSTEHCDLVNFDWYHPPYAYRFTVEEMQQLALDNGLRITRCQSAQAQHYLEAVRPNGG
jgi:SAM-dependent methyltransferase